MASTLSQVLSIQSQNLARNIAPFSFHRHARSVYFNSAKLPSFRYLSSNGGILQRCRAVSSEELSSSPEKSKNYEFLDTGGELELRFEIGSLNVESPKDVFVDADDTSILIRVKSAGILKTLIHIDPFFERVKSSETIWYIDEDQLVVNLKKFNKEVNWPDIMESWETLTKGIIQFTKGISIYIVGDSTEINNAIANEIATGLEYIPLCTSELLEQYSDQSIDSWVDSEGVDPVAEAETVILENLSTQVRAVIGTLGGKQGAASRFDKWRHIHGGFSIWVSKSRVYDEASAQEEARKNVNEGNVAYAKSDVIVKIGDWDEKYTRDVAKGCLLALKQLNLSDKKLQGKKSLYIRLGCRGDWPDIMAPGWNPSTGVGPSYN